MRGYEDHSYSYQRHGEQSSDLVCRRCHELQLVVQRASITPPTGGALLEARVGAHRACSRAARNGGRRGGRRRHPTRSLEREHGLLESGRARGGTAARALLGAALQVAQGCGPLKLVPTRTRTSCPRVRIRTTSELRENLRASLTPAQVAAARVVERDGARKLQELWAATKEQEHVVRAAAQGIKGWLRAKHVWHPCRRVGEAEHGWRRRIVPWHPTRRIEQINKGLIQRWPDDAAVCSEHQHACAVHRDFKG